jgi:hypothetical protein
MSDEKDIENFRNMAAKIYCALIQSNILRNITIRDSDVQWAIKRAKELWNAVDAEFYDLGDKYGEKEET